MKFGKTIQRAQSLSEPSWHPYWLDYKQLKKTLKTLELPMHNAKPVQAPQDAASSGAEDSPDQVEVTTDKVTLAACSKAFFRLLHDELAKLSRFFSERETSLTGAANAFIASLRPRLDGGSPLGGFSAEELQQHISTVVGYYKQLMMLENFAILNYVGFSKILKKHDKMTRHSTRAKFMQNAVQKHPFTRYARLEKALQETEQLFMRLSATATPRSPLRSPQRAGATAAVCVDSASMVVTVPAATTQPAPAHSQLGALPPQASRPRLRTADKQMLQAIGAMRDMAAAATVADARGVRGVREALSQPSTASLATPPSNRAGADGVGTAAPAAPAPAEGSNKRSRAAQPGEAAEVPGEGQGKRECKGESESNQTKVRRLV